MFRYAISQLGVLAALMVAMSMIGVGATDTINRTGPVQPTPSVGVVMVLGCKYSGSPGNLAIEAKNTLNMTLAPGRVLSWSYKAIIGPAPGTFVSGNTTLVAPLAPGAWVVAAKAAPNVQFVSRCHVTTKIG